MRSLCNRGTARCLGAANEVRYIYDGNLVIQERDNFNVTVVSYTEGRDMAAFNVPECAP